MNIFIKKTMQWICTLFLISLIVFALFSVITGDPARVMLGMQADEAQVQALRVSLGLHRPLHVQYFGWLSNLFRGDLGASIRFRLPVIQLLIERLPVTLGLSFLALLMTLILSIPIGTLCARNPGGLLDRILSVSIHTIMAIPPFISGILLTMLFGFLFSFFSVGTYAPASENFGVFLKSLLLPALAAALPKIATTAKFIRGSIIEEKEKEYIRTAQSHGLSDFVVLRTHVLPNAFIPVLTVLAITASEIASGSLVVEQTFNLPGLGRLLLEGVSGRDFPLIQGIVMYTAFIIILLHLLTDILHSRIDPRIRAD